MPGPSNSKKKRKSQLKARKPKKRSPLRPPKFEITEIYPPPLIKSEKHHASPLAPVHPTTLPMFTRTVDETEKLELLLQQPIIYDPGNGPRVRDIRAFLDSKYFSQPPAWDNPLCAEFAQEEVLQMLTTLLPEETALILWYNKSREVSRICPACRRLYRLGDILADHVDGDRRQDDKRTSSPQLQREQELSGLCSPVCFIMASINYPSVIKSAWGRAEDEIDDAAWEMLSAPPQNDIHSDTGKTLGMLMRMTRLHDLGLAQLCLGLDVEDLDFGDDFGEVAR